MVQIKPFKGTRPYNESAENLIAPSTDYLTEERIVDIFEKNYWNYLKILNPVGQNKESDALKTAKNHFSEMKQNNIIKQDYDLCYYVYQIKTNNHNQIGFLAIANIDLFISKNIIKGHELTYENRTKERSEQILNLESQIGPIYLTYKDNSDLDDFLFQLTLNSPLYDFVAFDNSIHTLWKINDFHDINKLTNLASNLEVFYIADGHHRISAIKKIHENQSKNKKNDNLKFYDHFMFSAFPSSKVKIFDYNRVIQNLNGLTIEEFIKKIQNNFECIQSKKSVKPIKAREFGMYYNKKWFELKFINDHLLKDDVLSQLDINIINEYCIKDILGVKNVNIDNRIRFIAGCHGLEALEKKVDDNPDSIAFSIFPTQIENVIDVADKNLTMPPKSTWFDPKPLDGLVVFEFNQ